MLLTLSIFRHGKSSWADDGKSDHDRPLAARGERDTPRMAAWVQARRLVPDLVLCSSARRARETCDLLIAGLAPSPEVRSEDALYQAGPNDLLRRIRDNRIAHPHVMVIGHNPALQRLAADLAGAGDATSLKALREKFPSASLAVLRFDVERWKMIGPGNGELAVFMTPKSLPARFQAA